MYDFYMLNFLSLEFQIVSKSILENKTFIHYIDTKK
jgi:hypothetical protein